MDQIAMRKPGFGVVTLVVCLIAVLGFVVRLVSPFLPEPKPNRLAAETADYLRQGAHESVDWHTVSVESFALARRLNRPILMLVGTDLSQTGRYADNEIFRDPEVQSILAKNFLCIRVDGTDQPSWLSAFLPLTRTKVALTPGFQVWVLDAQGRQFDFLSPLYVDDFNARTFMELCLSALNRYREIQRPNSSIPPAGTAQQNDLALIASGSGTPVDHDGFTSDLLASIDPKYGGMPLGRAQYLRANPWRYLLMRGQVDVVRASLDPALRTSIVDWLDGGFFRASFTRDWLSTQVDKVSTVNADMAVVCAVLERTTGEPYYGVLARRTFDALLGGDLMRDGFVVPGRKGDDGVNYRSRRSSFSVRFLRELRQTGTLDDDTLDKLREDFNLRTEVNPQMIVSIRDWSLVTGSKSAETEKLLAQLRRAKESVPRVVNRGVYLDVNGHVCARLLWLARYWNDAPRLQRASDFFDRIDEFRAGDDVQHSLNTDRTVVPSLGDYLAYADAALEHYLARGDVGSLQSGLNVLLRAKFLYKSDVPGVWNRTTPPRDQPWPPNTTVPEVLDLETESTTAKMVRLCRAYGALGLRPRVCAELTSDALAAVEQLGGVVSTRGPTCASFMAAALETADTTRIFVSGPNAVEEANVFARDYPWVLCAPALGGVRPDLQRVPGLYLVREGITHGPLDPQKARAMLGMG